MTGWYEMRYEICDDILLFPVDVVGYGEQNDDNNNDGSDCGAHHMRQLKRLIYKTTVLQVFSEKFGGITLIKDCPVAGISIE